MVRNVLRLMPGILLLSMAAAAHADGVTAPFRCYQQPQDKYCVEGQVKDGTSNFRVAYLYLPVHENTYPPRDETGFYIYPNNMSFGAEPGDNHIYIQDDKSHTVFPIADMTSPRTMKESNPPGIQMFSQAFQLLNGVQMSTETSDHIAAPTCIRDDVNGSVSEQLLLETVKSTSTVVTFTSGTNSGSITDEYNYKLLNWQIPSPGQCTQVGPPNF
jgi:hypothetical protein